MKINRAFILLVGAVLFALTTFFLEAGTSLLGTKYDSKETMNKIVKVKNKTELEKIFEENSKPVYGDENGYVSLLRLDLVEAVGKGLPDKTLRVVINFLSDQKSQAEYRLNSTNKRIIIDVIKSSHYSYKQKEFVVKSLNIVPDRLWELKDYFLKPENQKTPLFKRYLKWCLSDIQDKDNFDFINKVFDKLDNKEKIEVIEKIDKATVNEADRQLRFLKKIADSGKYDKNLRKLARQRIGTLKLDYAQLISRLSKAETESDVKNILKEKLKNSTCRRNFDSAVFSKAITQAESLNTKKSIVKFLCENRGYGWGKIGYLLADIVISPDYPLELKKTTMSPSAFEYYFTFKESLIKYFSIKENRGSPLYPMFLELVATDADDEECFSFIQKEFDTFSDKEKIKIVNNLEYVNIKVPFDFLNNILKNKKYSKDLRVAVKKRLTMLESERRAEIEHNTPRSMKELVEVFLSGIEHKVQKLEKRAKKGDNVTKKDLEAFYKIFKPSNEMLEMIKSRCESNDDADENKIINLARSKLKELRTRVDKLLKDNNKINKKNDVDAGMTILSNP